MNATISGKINVQKNDEKKTEVCIGEYTIDLTPPKPNGMQDAMVRFSVGGALDNKLAKICEVELRNFDYTEFHEWGAYALLVSAVGGVLQTRRSAGPRLIVPQGRG